MENYNQKYYRNNLEKEKARKKAWREKNKDRLKAKRKEYYEANKDKEKEYRENNKEKLRSWHREYQLHKRHTDVHYKLSHNLRSRLTNALKGKTKSKRTLEILGCSVEELKQHLELKFEPGMTWENYGYYGWHIDHIIPCAVFDMAKDEEQEKCFHYSNLQPKWWKDNLSKGSNQN